jgi:signal transduction histidine kinase
VIVASKDLWCTLCDPNQLESALLNLAINARDAMPLGGKLTIATANARLEGVHADTPALAPGDYVCIGVTDTGTGMSAEVAARAFDPFFTTKPIGQGTGQGLSMIYGFARQSNGHVTIDSTLGRAHRSSCTCRVIAARSQLNMSRPSRRPNMPPPARPCWWSRTNRWCAA